MPNIDQNIKAFARMLWDAEGTYNAAHPSIMYRTIYGGEVLPDTRETWAGHPNRSILKWGKKSTAAGAYQFLYGTWLELQSQIVLPDFTPPSQDRAFAAKLQRLKTKGSNVYDLLMNGRFVDAIPRASSEWSSLPGGVHQRRTLAEVKSLFASSGGNLI